MNLKKRIEALSFLGEYISQFDERLMAHIHRTYIKNLWFTKENQKEALSAISKEFLIQEKLEAFCSNYNIDDNSSPKKIGLVPAANIPMVGFHDALCIFLSGNISSIRLSERDQFMLPYLIKRVGEEFPAIHDYFLFINNLPIRELDAVIATGSNNSARYFEQYFKDIPHIIRRSRTSVGVLKGNESKEELTRLGSDVFSYFGLGCRNVSKIYIPEKYSFDKLLECWHDEFKHLIRNDKFKNNFDYQSTILILNNQPFYNNGCVLLKEEEELSSPISVLNYEYYNDIESLEEKLNNKSSQLQCVVSNCNMKSINTVALGHAQSPGISDFADGVDTMQFILELN